MSKIHSLFQNFSQKSQKNSQPPIPLTKVLVTCPSCGNIPLTSADITLVLYSEIERSLYSFICSTCHQIQQVHATQETIEALRNAHVNKYFHYVPAEVLEKHQGEKISWNDVLDFTSASKNLDSSMISTF